MRKSLKSMQRRLRSQIPYVLMRLRKLQPELPVQNLQILSMKQHFVQYVTAENLPPRQILRRVSR